MTIRKKIIDMLKKTPLSLREISKSMGISEKEAADHLSHIQNSVKAEGMALAADPCSCLSCGFIFKSRKKFSRPGRCPACKRERIEDAVFYIR